jgi:hypothetical protein
MDSLLKRIQGIDRKLSADEQQRQLEIQQEAFIRLYLQAAEHGLLPQWIKTPAGDAELLPVWESLARAMEPSFPTLPRVDDIADGQIPLIGTGRALNVSPPERIGAWIQHACALIECMIGCLPAEGEQDIERPGGEDLTDPIPIVSIVKAVGRKAGRSDKLACKMKRRNYRVEKRAGKHHCQRADAVAMFPNHRQRIEEI